MKKLVFLSFLCFFLSSRSLSGQIEVIFFNQEDTTLIKKDIERIQVFGQRLSDVKNGSTFIPRAILEDHVGDIYTISGLYKGQRFEIQEHLYVERKLPIKVYLGQKKTVQFEFEVSSYNRELEGVEILYKFSDRPNEVPKLVREGSITMKGIGFYTFPLPVNSKKRIFFSLRKGPDFKEGKFQVNLENKNNDEVFNRQVTLISQEVPEIIANIAVVEKKLIDAISSRMVEDALIQINGIPVGTTDNNGRFTFNKKNEANLKFRIGESIRITVSKSGYHTISFVHKIGNTKDDPDVNNIKCELSFPENPPEKILLKLSQIKRKDTIPFDSAFVLITNANSEKITINNSKRLTKSTDSGIAELRTYLTREETARIDIEKEKYRPFSINIAMDSLLKENVDTVELFLSPKKIIKGTLFKVAAIEGIISVGSYLSSRHFQNKAEKITELNWDSNRRTAQTFRRSAIINGAIGTGFLIAGIVYTIKEPKVPNDSRIRFIINSEKWWKWPWTILYLLKEILMDKNILMLRSYLLLLFIFSMSGCEDEKDFWRLEKKEVHPECPTIERVIFSSCNNELSIMGRDLLGDKQWYRPQLIDTINGAVVADNLNALPGNTSSDLFRVEIPDGLEIALNQQRMRVLYQRPCVFNNVVDMPPLQQIEASTNLSLNSAQFNPQIDPCLEYLYLEGDFCEEEQYEISLIIEGSESVDLSNAYEYLNARELRVNTDDVGFNFASGILNIRINGDEEQNSKQVPITFSDCPIVGSVSKQSGIAGETIELRGESLFCTENTALYEVWFQGDNSNDRVLAEIVEVNNTSMQVIVPEGGPASSTIYIRYDGFNCESIVGPSFTYLYSIKQNRSIQFPGRLNPIGITVDSISTTEAHIYLVEQINHQILLMEDKNLFNQTDTFNFYAGCPSRSCGTNRKNTGIASSQFDRPFDIDIGIGANNNKSLYITEAANRIRRIDLNGGDSFYSVGSQTIGACTLGAIPMSISVCDSNAYICLPLGIAVGPGKPGKVYFREDDTKSIRQIDYIVGSCNSRDVCDLGTIQRSDSPLGSSLGGMDIDSRNGDLYVSSKGESKIYLYNDGDISISSPIDLGLNEKFIDLVVDEISNLIFFIREDSPVLGFFPISDPLKYHLHQTFQMCLAYLDQKGSHYLHLVRAKQFIYLALKGLEVGYKKSYLNFLSS